MVNLYGGSLHPDFSDDRYIEYASWMPIVSIHTHNNYCSGTLINQKFILTIKHAIEYNSNLEIIYNNQILKYNNIIIHKKLDLCLIKLKSIVNIDSLDLYSDTGLLVGKVCSIGGYGVYKSKSRTLGYDGYKRAGNNIVVWENSELFECSMDETDRVDLEFITTPGDSGGPVFIGNRLAGVNQYVKASDGRVDSSFGDRSGHIKISSAMSWINEHINN